MLRRTKSCLTNEGGLGDNRSVKGKLRTSDLIRTFGNGFLSDSLFLHLGGMKERQWGWRGQTW